jgi:hypothetical protein
MQVIRANRYLFGEKIREKLWLFSPACSYRRIRG